MLRRWPQTLAPQGIEAIVLRTINHKPTLWNAILPEQCRGLPAGLGEVDDLLDDPRFFEPFQAFFSPRLGRPSIPMETYLRMMFLRFRYRLGFEAVCREVADSLAWRRFCRLPLDAPVPHPNAIEDHRPLRGDGGEPVEQGVAGQGRRKQGGPVGPGAGRHHRRRGQ